MHTHIYLHYMAVEYEFIGYSKERAIELFRDKNIESTCTIHAYIHMYVYIYIHTRTYIQYMAVVYRSIGYSEETATEVFGDKNIESTCTIHAYIHMYIYICVCIHIYIYIYIHCMAVEYGSIGYSEERAIEVFGDKNIEIFRE
jgi:hypothetical protein